MKEVTFVCTNCGNVCTEDELITAENEEWYGGKDDQCCPLCEELCIEIVEDDDDI